MIALSAGLPGRAKKRVTRRRHKNLPPPRLQPKDALTTGIAGATRSQYRSLFMQIEWGYKYL